MDIWKSEEKSLLSKDEEKIKQLINKLRKERFNSYITHRYLVSLFNSPAIMKSGEIVPDFLKGLLKEKSGSFTSKIESLKEKSGSEASKNFPVVLEIGSFQGLGAKYMVKEFEKLGFNPKIHCVDLMYNYFEEISKVNYSIQGIHLLENTQPERRNDKIFLHSGKSSEILPVMNLKADVVYVDGEHTSGGVYLDLVMSLNQINNYGIVIVDDFDWHFKDNKSVMTGVKMFIKDYRFLNPSSDSNNESESIDAIVSMFSLSKKENGNYMLYEMTDISDIEKKDMKTKQLLLVCKYYENSVSKEDVLEKGLYFS